tara:strand:- start:259 stop:1281 length:1023 start_codon:yes stop_codon:yes gene_type:complete
MFWVILIVCSFFIPQDYPLLGSPNTFDIMTWNIENYPKNNSTNSFLENIISQINIDVIALQEIESQNAFENLISILGPNWIGLRSQNTDYGELAYLINTEEVQLVDDYNILSNNQYYFAYREPYVIEIIHNESDYIIINNHFKCCGNGNLDLNDTSDEEYRRLKSSELIFEYVNNNHPYEKVIILGDLNDEITDSPPNNVFLDFINSNLYSFADNQIAYGDQDDWSFPNWPSHIDHIILSNELFELFEPEDIKTFKIDEYLGGWQAYENYISDHRPLFLKIDYNQIIGDLNQDSEVNILDTVILVQIILGTNLSDLVADLNQDGIVNVLDVVQLVQIILN